MIFAHVFFSPFQKVSPYKNHINSSHKRTIIKREHGRQSSTTTTTNTNKMAEADTAMIEEILGEVYFMNADKIKQTSKNKKLTGLLSLFSFLF